MRFSLTIATRRSIFAFVMTPEQLRQAFAAKGFRTQKEAATALRVDPSTISHWMTGKIAVPGIVELALASIPKRAQSSAKTAKRGAK